MLGILMGTALERAGARPPQQPPPDTSSDWDKHAAKQTVAVTPAAAERAYA